MLTKIRAKRHSKLNTGIMLVAMTCLILMDCLPIFAAADCPVIDDLPMGLQIKGAPPILMFTIDDSGSMDFSITLEDKNFVSGSNSYNHWGEDGEFDISGRRAYIYDVGDHQYGERVFDGEEHIYWYTQFFGTNKQYYNPSMTYAPWPLWNHPDILQDAATWDDPNTDTEDSLDMDPVNPRSNPMRDDWTVNMDGDYYTWDSGGGLDTETLVGTIGAVIVDDSETGSGTVTDEIIIDEEDTGFSKSDGGWNHIGKPDCYDGECYLSDFDGNAWVKWETAVDSDAEFEVYARWDDSTERGDTIPYHIHHSGTGTPAVEYVDQEFNGGDWVRLGTDRYTFGTGTAKITIGEVSPYTVEETKNEICADAIKLKCVANCSSGETTPPFQFTGSWTSNTGPECLGPDYTQSVDEQPCIRAADNGLYTATWTATDLLDPDTDYDVYAWWEDSSSRSNNVVYKIYDGSSAHPMATVPKNQRTETDGYPQLLESGLRFYSGTGVVESKFAVGGSNEEVVADAVGFTPSTDPSLESLTIRNAHYYIHTQYDEHDNDGDGEIDESDESEIYLVNFETAYASAADDTLPKYYQVSEDSVGRVIALEEKTAAEAGLEYTIRRTYKRERANFANWFSFYRRRELTAKNAVAKVITDMQGVFIGILTLNNDITQEALPVKVTHESGTWDETYYLIKKLYRNWNASGGTPLRNALKKTGRYFKGEEMAPSDIYPDGSNSYTTSEYYPFYPQGEGGECQQSFCILMTDGFWSGSSPSVDNEDNDGDSIYDRGVFGDVYSNTLADVAMRFYENDLNSSLDDSVPQSPSVKKAISHQHMVTYGLSFGVKGTIDPDAYPDCPGEAGSCPTWPDPTNSKDEERVDDLYHAAINGRGLYLNASNPEELVEAMNKLKEDIEARAIRSEASASVNGQELITGSQLYIAGYNSSGWAGVVTAWNLDPSDGAITSMAWNAAEKIETRINDESLGHADRLIATYSGTAGVAFEGDLTGLHSDLSTDVVNYLRGDKTNEQQNEGSFRNRKTRWVAGSDTDAADFTLGDIIHSSPVFHDDAIYVGANDGMLHAFAADTGEELFAYVPSLVHDNLKSLTDTEQGHKYFVDLTPTVRSKVDITPADPTDDNISLLVGGLGKGGKGYFALDVTDARKTGLTISDVNDMVLWEFDGLTTDILTPDSPTGAALSDDMGYSFSRPVISKTKSSSYPWVVIFGNGYASNSGTSSLFIIDPSDGSIIRYLNTGITGSDTCNGMSSPFPADIDNDGYVDYIYVGDLNGNMWKIDMTSSDETDWDFAFLDGSLPEPLFTARDGESTTNPQPITGRPDVTDHCSGIGQMVIFGTGQLMGTPDMSDSSQQTLYGIWDYGEAGAVDEYVGTFQRPDDLSKWATSSTITVLEQSSAEATSGGETLRVFTDKAPNWTTTEDLILPKEVENPAPNADPPAHAAWYFDLPDTKERITQNVLIQTGKALVVSNIPGGSGSVCSAGGAGSSYIQAIDPCSGGRISTAVFDINDDGLIDESDILTVTYPDDSSSETIKVPATAIKGEGLLYAPAVVTSGETEYLYNPTNPLNPEGPITGTGAELGMIFWIQHRE